MMPFEPYVWAAPKLRRAIVSLRLNESSMQAVRKAEAKSSVWNTYAVQTSAGPVGCSYCVAPVCVLT